MIKSLTWKENVPGASRPWRVLAWDDPDAGGLPREFIVKHFRSDQRFARIVEYVAGRFAFDTDINSIEPRFVEFTPAFLTDLQTLPVQPRDAHLAEPGIHVAFAWNASAVALMDNHRAMDSLENPEQLGEIVGVDTVLINFDRSDQNVLFEPLADYRSVATHVLHPIDWNLCFAGGEAPFNTLQTDALLRMTRPWTDSGSSRDTMCGRISSSSDFLTAIRKLGTWNAAKARIRLLVNGVPSQWAFSDPEKTAVVDFLLARVDATIKRLRLPNDPDNIFPNWQGTLALDSSA